MSNLRQCLCGNEFRKVPGGKAYCSLGCALWSRTFRSVEGCIVWVGSSTRDGYGTLHWDGKHYTAHRAAWVLAHGEEPGTSKRRHLHHICGNPRCVHPDHLELVTAKEHRREHMS